MEAVPGEDDDDDDGICFARDTLCLVFSYVSIERKSKRSMQGSEHDGATACLSAKVLLTIINDDRKK